MKPEPVTVSKGLMSLQHNETHALVTSSFTFRGAVLHKEDGCKCFSVLLWPALNLQER
jgi:hypothetical protein